MVELTATYRLQLRTGMTFEKAEALVPYLAKLGISHLYLSPPFRARQGSTHGYDVADFNELDPELGGEAAFRSLAQALRRHGLGLILDIVPNHMAASTDNPWWRDMLRLGPKSPWTRCFDIDMEARAGGTPGKVLLPILGEPFGRALEGGAVKLGEDALLVYDQPFPLHPDTDRSRGLESALASQAYRLAWWRLGDQALNWRRFFNVTELAGTRMEDPEVFALAHEKLLELVRDGLIDGVRIDHIDGLRDPAGYLRLLRTALAETGKEVSIHIEKILGPDETLPEGWDTAGTTGYEILNDLNGLFVDPAGEATLGEIWQTLAGPAASFETTVREAKRFVLGNLLRAELERLVIDGMRLAAASAVWRDLGAPAWRKAVAVFIEALPIYRTYRDGGALSDIDRQRIETALAEARRGWHPPVTDALDFLGGELLLTPRLEGDVLDLIARLQQLSGPVMAKALEDTAFYRWHRLIALNEVGGEPLHFGLSPATFHAHNAARNDRHPLNLVATATHDTKRGEDTRLRIDVLSEIPERWHACVAGWRERNEALRRREGFDDPSTEYLLYQTLVGTWPLGAGEAPAGYADRICKFLEKAVREGKLRSSWTSPDERYEAGLKGLARALLDPASGRAFLDELRALVAEVTPAAALHGLSQTLLKLTIPGVPDIYQGTEGWDLSLVDPDNRRPVDHAGLTRALDAETGDEELLASWADGRVKQRLLARVLPWRKAEGASFAKAGYLPVPVDGRQAERVVAFARSSADGTAVVLAPRLAFPLVSGGSLMPDPAAWADTRVDLGVFELRACCDVVSGAMLDLESDRPAVADILRRWPVALLVGG